MKYKCFAFKMFERMLWEKNTVSYTAEDRDKIEKVLSSVSFRNYGSDSGFEKCKSASKVDVKNPVYKFYKTKRTEPPRLRVYIAAYIVEHGYRVVGKTFHLRHLCHRGPYCFEVSHLEYGTAGKNSSETSCKKTLVVMSKNKSIRTKTYMTLCCERHDPCCFYNVGQSDV